MQFFYLQGPGRLQVMHILSGLINFFQRQISIFLYVESYLALLICYV